MLINENSFTNASKYPISILTVEKCFIFFSFSFFLGGGEDAVCLVFSIISVSSRNSVEGHKHCFNRQEMGQEAGHGTSMSVLDVDWTYGVSSLFFQSINIELIDIKF